MDGLFVNFRVVKKSRSDPDFNPTYMYSAVADKEDPGLQLEAFAPPRKKDASLVEKDLGANGVVWGLLAVLSVLWLVYDWLTALKLIYVQLEILQGALILCAILFYGVVASWSLRHSQGTMKAGLTRQEVMSTQGGHSLMLCHFVGLGIASEFFRWAGAYRGGSVENMQSSRDIYAMYFVVPRALVEVAILNFAL